MNRIEQTFKRCRAESRAAFVAYMMAHDPGREASAKLLHALPGAGADIIELGMPFSDPMADGPVIQQAAQRALAAGGSVHATLELVSEFRTSNSDTPIILMGYYNPVYHYGIEDFVRDAVQAGVDGVILVDLTPEEEQEFVDVSEPQGLAHIKLTAPTTTKERAEIVLKRASGFMYYISVTGITGSASSTRSKVAAQLDRLREVTDLPIAVGFGIKTPEQASEFAQTADAVVVGSAIVQQVAELGDQPDALLEQVTHYVSQMTSGLARRG